jgi:hypothetical protein
VRLRKERKISPNTPDLDFCSIAELTKALRSRKISASELLEHVITRIEALDQRLNAVVVRDFERAQAMAKAADTTLARGDQRPLLGIPVTLKEPFNIAGLPTTWGYPEFRDFVPTEDALIVSRLKAAGAVVIGKTNIPLGLRDFQSYNDIYGTTNTPGIWPLSRWLLGWVSRLARRRLRSAFDRLGYRWIRSRACTFLRCLWTQDEPRRGPASRIHLAARSTRAR